MKLKTCFKILFAFVNNKIKSVQKLTLNRDIKNVFKFKNAAYKEFYVY